MPGQLRHNPLTGCPGNEPELEVILCEKPARNGGGWAIRVVTNRFAAAGPVDAGSDARVLRGEG